MGLLKPKKSRRRPIRKQGTLRCVAARNQAGWCRQICEPVGDHGTCGRVAPHRLRGRTQDAIAGQKRR